MRRRNKIFAKAQSGVADTKNRSWYRIEARVCEDGKPDAGKLDSIEVLIYDEIGHWGITAAQFLDGLKAVDDGTAKVTVAINSPGGDVFDGFAIHNALVRLGDRCTVRIDGLAASAASVIACGGHHVVMAENAMMMIHNPWTLAYGESEDLRKTADMMDKARDGILASYRRKAPSISDADLIKMLDEETWLTAEEAVALGLADAIGEKVQMKACKGATGVLARFKNLPKALFDSDAEPTGHEPEPAPDFAKDATKEPPGSDLESMVAKAAAAITGACLKAGIPEIAEERIMSTTLTDLAAATTEAERILAIHDLCVLAKMPDLAADYVKSGISADAVRARLLDKITQDQGPEINNKEPVVEDKQKPRAKTPNSSAIYAARKGKGSAKAE